MNDACTFRNVGQGHRCALEITDCIDTIDAMGTQSEIAKKIIGKGTDYTLALKGNQLVLYENIQLFLRNTEKTQMGWDRIALPQATVRDMDATSVELVHLQGHRLSEWLGKAERSERNWCDLLPSRGERAELKPGALFHL